MDVSVEVLGSARVFHLKNDGHHRLFFFSVPVTVTERIVFMGFNFHLAK